MPSIRNDNLRVDISTQGAELQSIYNKQTALEYLWNGGPQWPKRSPVLFPIIGELKGKTYTYKDQSYKLSRHGFARDMMFGITAHTETSVTFSLRDTVETLNVYPFPFLFFIQYTLDANRLYVLYTVENTGGEPMYFSVGGHPAFKMPITKDTAFEDYYLAFSQVENTGRYPLSPDGLVETTPVTFLSDAEKLPLERSLFYNDALVFKDLQSASITLESDKTAHGLTFYFEQFPYLGIWNKKDADFICLEPWCGIADTVDASGQLTEKEGINTLQPKEIFEKQWSVEVF